MQGDNGFSLSFELLARSFSVDAFNFSLAIRMLEKPIGIFGLLGKVVDAGEGDGDGTCKKPKSKIKYNKN